MRDDPSGPKLVAPELWNESRPNVQRLPFRPVLMLKVDDGEGEETEGGGKHVNHASHQDGADLRPHNPKQPNEHGRSLED